MVSQKITIKNAEGLHARPATEIAKTATQYTSTVELDVMGNNERAIALYQKFGFVECGRVPHGIKFIDGSYTDLVTMIKMLK